jgi:hypothetical protein
MLSSDQKAELSNTQASCDKRLNAANDLHNQLKEDMDQERKQVQEEL